VGVGVPRWHAAGTQHLADHGREATHPLVAGHGPGADAARAVAPGALLRQQRRHLAGIGGWRGLLHVHQAAHRLHLGDRGLAAGQQRFERVGQVVARGGGLLGAVGQPVVHGAAIGQGAGARVHHEHLGSAGDAH
jgi:hypothetical protein